MQVDHVGPDLADDPAQPGPLGDRADAGLPDRAPLHHAGATLCGQRTEPSAGARHRNSHTVTDLMRNVVSDTMRKPGIHGMGYVKDMNRRHC